MYDLASPGPPEFPPGWADFRTARLRALERARPGRRPDAARSPEPPRPDAVEPGRAGRAWRGAGA